MWLCRIMHSIIWVTRKQRWTTDLGSKQKKRTRYALLLYNTFLVVCSSSHFYEILGLLGGTTSVCANATDFCQSDFLDNEESAIRVQNWTHMYVERFMLRFCKTKPRDTFQQLIKVCLSSLNLASVRVVKLPFINWIIVIKKSTIN